MMVVWAPAAEGGNSPTLPVQKMLNLEETMKQSTKNRIEGKLREMKGKAKEKAGQVTNNRHLVAEGYVEKFAGKIQGKIGQIEKVFGR